MFTRLALISLASVVSATVLYDGLIPLNWSEALLDANAPPYTT